MKEISLVHLFFNIVTIYDYIFFHSFYPFVHSIYEESFWLAADPFAHSCLKFGIR